MSIGPNPGSRTGRGRRNKNPALLTAIAVSGQAQIDLPIPQGWSHIQLKIAAGSTNNNGATSDVMYMRFNGDTTVGHYGWTNVAGYGNGGGFSSGDNNSSALYVSPLASMNGTGSPYGMAIVDIFDYGLTQKICYLCRSMCEQSN